MSIKSAESFIEKLKTDEEFAKKIITSIKDTASHIAIAKIEGFDFTAEEFKDAGGRLNSEELDQVSGGLAQSVMVNGEKKQGKPIDAIT